MIETPIDIEMAAFAARSDAVDNNASTLVTEAEKKKCKCVAILMGRGWTAWSDLKLWWRIYRWGLYQKPEEGKSIHAVPGFRMKDNKHVAYVIKGDYADGVSIQMPKVRDAFGTLTSTMIEAAAGECCIYPHKVHTLFQEANANKEEGFDLAIPSMLLMGDKKVDTLDTFRTEHLCIKGLRYERVKAGELHDPNMEGDPSDFMMKVMLYGRSKGYPFAFPTFEKVQDPADGLVYGVCFFPEGMAEERLLFDSQLPPVE